MRRVHCNREAPRARARLESASSVKRLHAVHQLADQFLERRQLDRQPADVDRQQVLVLAGLVGETDRFDKLGLLGFHGFASSAPASPLQSKLDGGSEHGA